MKKLDEVSRSLSSGIKDHFLERLPDAELEIVVEAALSELAEYGPIQTNTNLLPVCDRIWARCRGIEFKPQRDIESALSSKAGSPIQDIRSIVRALMRAEDLEKMLLQERTRIDSTLKYLARGNRAQPRRPASARRLRVECLAHTATRAARAAASSTDTRAGRTGGQWITN